MNLQTISVGKRQIALRTCFRSLFHSFDSSFVSHVGKRRGSKSKPHGDVARVHEKVHRGSAHGLAVAVRLGRRPQRNAHPLERVPGGQREVGSQSFFFSSSPYQCICVFLCSSSSLSNFILSMRSRLVSCFFFACECFSSRSFESESCFFFFFFFFF